MNRLSALLAAVVLLPGCGAIGPLLSLLNRIEESGSAKLIRFESEEQLLDYFQGEIDARQNRISPPFPFGIPSLDDFALSGDESAPVGPPMPSDGQASVLAEGGDRDSAAFSETTIQEAGVDEADVVKTDGERLYVISRGSLRIVRIVPSTELVLESEIDVAGYAREMYLDEGRVIALSEDFGAPVLDDLAPGEPDGDSGASSLAPVRRPKTIVTVIDTSTPGTPVARSETRFEGTLSASRKIGGMLYLVMSNYQNYYVDVMPLLGRAAMDLASVGVADLLPNYERVDAEGVVSGGDMVSWEDMYRPTDRDGFGVVSVVSMNLDDGGSFKAVGVVAEPGLVYSSTEALYLTDHEYDPAGFGRESADIYKFSYDEGFASPTATGTVPGRILNQYSMGEYEGFLRVATTVRPAGFAPGDPHNDVYVLEQQGEELVVVGSIQGIAPRETIQSARFIGDRGYVVTFEQIDPLFTLDLSNPTNPVIVGELKVPGFSTFIVPMDDDHLLTVGQYIPDDPRENGFFRPWGVQLSIFDVSDFANPVLSHNVVLGEETGAYSEALFNPKAFTYFAEAGKIALPIEIQADFPVFFDDVVVIEPGGETGGGDRDSDGDETEGGGREPGGDAVVIIDEPASPPTVIDEPVAPPTVIDEPVAPPIVIDEPVAPRGFSGLVVFDVSTGAGFEEMTRISTRFEQAGFFGGSFTRGVFIGEDVFAVTDLGVHGEVMNADARFMFELFFGAPFVPDELIITDLPR